MSRSVVGHGITGCLSRLAVGGILVLAAGATSVVAMSADIIIGTGSKAGVYYQVGRAICRLVNAETADHGVNCEAVATQGSIFNLEALRDGKLPFAIAQSDWQFHATRGSGPFSDTGPDTNLRALFSIHGEPFTVVARSDSGIHHLDDLEGARVNVGNPGSGQRATMGIVMTAKNWALSDFMLAEQLPASQQSLALCHDRVQAMVYTVGHPNPSVSKAVGLCDALLVEVSGPEIDRLVAENSFYAYTTIPGGIYHNNPDQTKTFGVKATAVTSANVDSTTVYVVVKALFDGLNDFRGMHPAWGGLEAARMTSDGLSAPLHEGALRYYAEVGLR